MSDSCYQFIASVNNFRPVKDITKDLEEGSDQKKYDALKEVILLHMNGQPQPKLLMAIIRYVLPSPFKPLKKLLLYYWEIIQKRGPGGELREEIILVCERLRRDLEHPNEYIRGATLRLLSKLHEADILEPLIPAILENLENRRGYVRRNAILTVYSIAKDDTLAHLIPDAADTILELLEQEVDVSAKRNAFLMLQDCAPDKAALYLRGIIKNVSNLGNLFQLQILRLLKDMCKEKPEEKFKYLRIISSLISSKSNSVLYQCANTLTELSSSPVAIRTAARCFTKLLLNETDDNVKGIVFERIIDLKNRHPVYLREAVSDLLRIIKTTNEFSMKTKVVSAIQHLVCPANIVEILTCFKNELAKSKAKRTEVTVEENYRMLILKIMDYIFETHVMGYDSDKSDVCISRNISDELLKEILRYYLHLLDYLGDCCGQSVVIVTRKVMEMIPTARSEILDLIYSNLCDVKEGSVYRLSLWVLAEYCESLDSILASFDSLLAELSPLMLRKEDDGESTQAGSLADGQDEDFPDDVSVGSSSYSYAATKQVVREDGTYQTETVDENVKSKGKKSTEGQNSSLSNLLKDDTDRFFLSCAVAMGVTKLSIKLRKLSEGENDGGEGKLLSNKYNARAMMVLCMLLRIGKDNGIDSNSEERVSFCLKLLLAASGNNRELFEQLLLQEGRTTYRGMLASEMRNIELKKVEETRKKQQTNKVDTSVQISQLLTQTFDAFAEEDKSGEVDEGVFETKALLGRVVQLSGCSDAIYSEAHIKTNEFDVVLSILLVNQTKETLENISIELNTQGDLEVCEVPQTYTLEPSEQLTVKINVKVTSTETGNIFGNIAYTVSGQTSWNFIVLSEILVNSMEYVIPKECDQASFMKMWRKFEWENKLLVRCKRFDCSLWGYVHDIEKITKMKILHLPTTKSRDEGGQFLSCNLYATSTFGESALLNISIEKHEKDEKTTDGNNLSIEGLIRIRSKTSGIARSLGNIVKEYQIGHGERK